MVMDVCLNINKYFLQVVCRSVYKQKGFIDPGCFFAIIPIFTEI